jgi:hypothetical protein
MNVENLRKGQLIEKVLKHYKFHIEYIRNNLSGASYDSILLYCKEAGIEYGICSYMSTGFGLGSFIGYNFQWVKKYNNFSSSHWGKCPIDVWRALVVMEDRLDERLTQEFILQSYLDALQLRVDNLEKELASGDKLHQRVTSKNC